MEVETMEETVSVSKTRFDHSLRLEEKVSKYAPFLCYAPGFFAGNITYFFLINFYLFDVLSESELFARIGTLLLESNKWYLLEILIDADPGWLRKKKENFMKSMSLSS